MKCSVRTSVLIAGVATVVTGLPASSVAASVSTSVSTVAPQSSAQPWSVTVVTPPWTVSQMAGSSASPAATDSAGTASSSAAMARPARHRHRSTSRSGWRTGLGWHATAWCHRLTAAGTWQVRPGDTVALAASCTGTTVTAIAAASGLVDSGLVHVGQQLTIPHGARR